MRLEAGLVVQTFAEPAVITVGLVTFEAGRKQGRKLLGGVSNWASAVSTVA